jgi:hypothetical protein
MPCLYGGTCVVVNSTLYVCICPTGWTGQRCNIPNSQITNACSSNPCPYGQSCTSLGSASSYSMSNGGYYCTSTNQNPYQTPSNNQYPYQTQTNNQNPYQTQTNNQNPYQTQTNNQNPYQTQTNNQNPYQSPTTQYHYQTTYSGSACLSPTLCLNGGTCISQNPGYFSCLCANGFTGLRCETQGNVNYPQQTTRPPLSPIYTTQQPPQPTPQPQTQPQYPTQYTTKPASNNNMCQMNYCYNGGTCRTQAGYNGAVTVVCYCTTGFTGSRCHISQQTQYSDYVEPKCPDGFCVRGECLSYGSGSFYCKCNNGWTGQNCNIYSTPQQQQQNVTVPNNSNSVCRNNPCFNGGTCYSSIYNDNQYYCYCQNGFNGDRCQNLINYNRRSV